MVQEDSELAVSREMALNNPSPFLTPGAGIPREMGTDIGGPEEHRKFLLDVKWAGSRAQDLGSSTFLPFLLYSASGIKYRRLN